VRNAAESSFFASFLSSGKKEMKKANYPTTLNNEKEQ